MRPNSPRAQLTKKYALAESRCQPDDPASAGPSSSQTSSRRLLGVALGIGVYRRRAGFSCTSPCKSRSHWARVALSMQVSRWLPPLSRSPRPADRPRSITRLRAPFRELSNSELNLSWAVRIERPYCTAVHDLRYQTKQLRHSLDGSLERKGGMRCQIPEYGSLEGGSDHPSRFWNLESLTARP